MIPRILLTALLLTALAGPAGAATGSSLLQAREGAASLLRGKFEKAIAAYDEALKAKDLSDANRANIYNDRGVANWRLKRIKAAISDFNAAIELFPDFAIVYNNRGNALLQLGRPDEALRDFNRAVILAPGYGAAYNNRGNAHLALGDYEGALKDFHKAAAMMSTNAVPFNGRGKAHSSLGRPFAAIRDYNKAIALNSKYSGALINRAEVYAVLDRYNDAIKDYAQAIASEESNEANPSLYLARARAYANARKYRSALNDLNKAIEDEPQFAAAFAVRGSVYSSIGQLEQARADLSMAIALEPERAENFVERASVFLRTGLPEEALRDIESAIEVGPETATQLHLKGEILERLEQPEAAVAAFSAALVVDPRHGASRNALRKRGIEVPPLKPAEPLGEPVEDWIITEPKPGQFVATNKRYPKVRVNLEMYGPGKPTILEWQLLQYDLQGIGLLRYFAGLRENKADAPLEYIAIVDLWKAKVVAVEPNAWGDQRATWTWKQASVVVTDPEGTQSEVTLRTVQPDSYGGSGYDPWFSDQHSQQPAERPRPQRRRRGGGGLLDWLFN